jgi:hypothetical protein
MYNQRFGPTITGMLDASSGMGGNGGNGFGAGIGGKGGSGGNAGTITTYQIPVRGTVNNTAVNFVSATTWVPQLLGSLGVGNQGGGAGASQIFKINF